ncbi:hypothetical protein [Stieleria varia]|uniref:hypothetical protein n=1 Tax=Stieleria varia TaxID=2528005 RepID=UPI001E605A86|nr:hypothetical protein [Stieleria varia]
MSTLQEDGPPQSDPGLIGTLVYGLSLPERTARSASAVVGGLVNETAGWVIPAAFRSSRTYRSFVQQALDIMIHDVGGVSNPNASATEEETQLAQKAVSGLVDFAGAATLHLSPLTVLAVFNDLAYGSSHYLKKLSEELKREGIIDAESSIDQVSDLVDALHKTSDRAVGAMEAPPISVQAVSETITKLSDEIRNVDPMKLIPQSEIERMWNEMEDAASQSNAGLWAVGTTMTMFAINRLSLSSRGALSGVTVAGSLFDEHILRHYRDGLDDIAERGLYVSLSEASQPYLDALWHNFDADRETWTAEIITGRLPKKVLQSAWQTIKSWFCRSNKSDDGNEST